MMRKYFIALFLLVAFVGTSQGIKCYFCEHFDTKLEGADSIPDNDESCKNGKTPDTSVDCNKSNMVFRKVVNNQSEASYIAVSNTERQTQNATYACVKFSLETKIKGEKLKWIQRGCYVPEEDEKTDYCEKITLEDMSVGGLPVDKKAKMQGCVCDTDNCNSGFSLSFSIFTVAICLITSAFKVL